MDAGEGQEALVAAGGIRAGEEGESSAEVAALIEAVDGRDGGGAKRAVVGAEGVPRMVDDLPQSVLNLLVAYY